ncbi:MAG TPA: hypothetical protein VMR62_19530 [Bryobacteraceae bacterium]|jgi:hypothetical protein|nr:hypothetical protein [Bryobacteraceae bacterium]
MIPRLTLLLAIFTAAIPVRADLQQAKGEPNLGKRSVLALDNAADALAKAREAYAKGDNAHVQTLAREISESVELAETSLHDTGKNPRKSPKWFKRAEGSTRDLLRRLDSFQQSMDITDRPMLDPVKAKVQQVHDDLLEGVLEGKEK